MSRPSIDPTRLDSNWRAISAELDAPEASRLERLMAAVRIPMWVSRLVLSTPALRRAWYIALGVSVLVGLAATNENEPRQSLFTFLVLAPLVPVLGVAMAYGPSADPAYEAQLATPMSGLRMVAIRTATVLAVSIVVLTLTGLISPVVRPMAAAWLLPALAVTSGSLALMTFLAPRRATSLMAIGWVVVAAVARSASTDALAAFAPAAQVAALIATIVFIGATVARRASFEQLEVRA